MREGNALEAVSEARQRRQVAAAGVVESWRYTLRGIWESALRLDELMHVAWDMPGYIVPGWKPGRLPVLRIPSSMQENATEEEIPLLPGFERLSLETPEAERTGWVFNPIAASAAKVDQPERLTVEHVGRVLSRIGKAAGIVVDLGDQRTKKPEKFASAHNLRRSCAERMLAAGVPPLVISRVLRHSSWETTRRHYAAGDVQRDAGLLRDMLAP